jgi:ATP-dependent 26S proteasome regulatory subunit
MAKSPLIKDVLMAASQGHPPSPQDVEALINILSEDEQRQFIIELYSFAIQSATGNSDTQALRGRVAELEQQLQKVVTAPARLGILFDILEGIDGQRGWVAVDGGGLMDMPIAIKEPFEIGDRVGIVTGEDGAALAHRYGPFAGGTNLRYNGRENGHLVLENEHGDTVRAAVAPTLDQGELEEGRSVIRVAVFGPHDALALGIVAQQEGDGLGLMSPMPRGVTFDEIAGLDPIVADIMNKVTIWYRPDITDIYNRDKRKPVLDRKRGILLTGMPGTGKTVITYAVRSYAEELLGREIPAFEMTSARLLSHWHGMSSKNIARAADAAHRAGRPECPSLCAWQDIESLVVDRRQADMAVTTRITTTMNQILDDRERNWLPIATANLPDLIDASTLDRWHVIQVPVPSEAGIRAILQNKLDQTITARPPEEISEAVVGAMRGDFIKATIAGQIRTFERLSLLTGRKIMKAVEQAAEGAAVRDHASGITYPSGVAAEDIITALQAQFDALGRSIAPKNAVAHLPLSLEEGEHLTNIHVVPRQTRSAAAARFVRAA